MSSDKTICAFNHKEWDDAGLENYEDFSDKIEYVNQREIGDCSEGEWFYIADKPRPDGSKVIYHGTFGNYNSPGASSYTYAEIFENAPCDEEDIADGADPNEFCNEAYDDAVDHWESQEEWAEDDEDDEDDEDEEHISDDDGWTDVEADADTLRSAGYGTDEDYGFFGGNDDY